MSRGFSILILALLSFLPGCSTTPDSTLVAGKNTATFTGTYIRVKDADVAPVLMRQTPPTSPRELRKKGFAGSATIELNAEDSGHITQVQLRDASDQVFGAAAVSAVKQWDSAPVHKGYATVDFIIDESGNITQIQFKEASDHAFGDVAVAALKKMRFEPARKDGRAIACLAEVKMHFVITEE